MYVPGEVQFTVNGNIDVQGDETYNYPTGISMYQGSHIPEAEAQITVTGDVNVQSAKSGASISGVTFNAVNESTYDIDIQGEINVTADNGQARGINASADNSNATVSIAEGMNVEGTTGENIGINAKALNQGELMISIGGINIDGEKATAVQLDNQGGTIQLDVNGDVVSSDKGMIIHGENAAGSDSVTIHGDVSAETDAVYIDVQNDKSELDLLIDGTISGETSSVVLSEDTISDNVTLTVWEIKANEDGSVAQREETTDNKTSRTEDETFEKKIQYIIRLDQTTAGATLSTSGTTRYEGYDVAHEGDKVILKVDVDPKYTIDSAYNGTETKVALLKDSDGQYYLEVPRGGAVLLSVTLKPVEPEEPEETGEKEEPKEEDTRAEEPKAEETKAGDAILEEAEPEEAKPEEPILVVTPVNYPVNLEEDADAVIIAAIEEALEGTGATAEVEPAVNETGKKIVVITAEEGSSNLSVELSADLLEQMEEGNVVGLYIQGTEDACELRLSMDQLKTMLAGTADARLVIELENDSGKIGQQMDEELLGKISEEWVIEEGSIAVLKITLKNPDGSETDVTDTAALTLRMKIEKKDGMKILYIDQDNSVTDTEAEWIPAADGQDACWAVPYMGSGIYLPVVPVV